MKLVRKGWAQQWQRRLHGAACRGRADLGWIEEGPPSRQEFEAMREVCWGCPVRRACAEFVLDPDSGVQGGMYAGVWVPWRGQNEDRAATRGHTRGRHEIKALMDRLVRSEFQQLLREKNNA